MKDIDPNDQSLVQILTQHGTYAPQAALSAIRSYLYKPEPRYYARDNGNWINIMDKTITRAGHEIVTRTYTEKNAKLVVDALNSYDEGLNK